MFNTAYKMVRGARPHPIHPSAQIAMLWQNLQKAAFSAEVAEKALEVVPPQGNGAIEFVRPWLKFQNAWEVLPVIFERVMARPAPAYALRFILQDAEAVRVDLAQRGAINDIRSEIDGMCSLISRQAMLRLVKYWERKARGEEIKQGDRPADIYRDYGLALRYAVEELGHIEARKVLKLLMQEVTLPFDELENPDWLCPYTGQYDLSWEETRVKKTDAEILSNVGNPEKELARMLGKEAPQKKVELPDDPAQAQEFLEQLMEDKQADFQAMLKQLGWTEVDYFREAGTAQKGGYNERVGDVAEICVEFESEINDKDFEYKRDVEVTGEANELRQMLDWEIRGLRWEIREAFGSLSPQRASNSRLTEAMRRAIVRGENSRRLFKFLNQLAPDYKPQDILAVLLPFQNEFCYTLEDLARVKIPGYRNLARWFQINGDAFLEQFNDPAGKMYDDPSEEFLENYARWTMEDQIRTYLSPFGAKEWNEAFVKSSGKTLAARRAQAWQVFDTAWKADPFKRYGPGRARPTDWGAAHWVNREDARFAPEFVEAEIYTAVLSDSGVMNALEAGWEAWRKKLSPAANKVYHDLFDHWTAIQDAIPSLKAKWERLKESEVLYPMPYEVVGWLYQEHAGWDPFIALIRECKEDYARVYERILKMKTKRVAMKAFWEVVKGDKNRISAICKDGGGLVLGDGRRISWKVAILKLQAGELNLDVDTGQRLSSALTARKISQGLPFALELEKWLVQQAEAQLAF